MYYAPLVSIVVTLALTPLLIFFQGWRIQDVPNERSLHLAPVPRVGGIALIAGVFLGWISGGVSAAWWVVLPVLGLFVLSLADDVRNLSPKVRLAGHFVAASLALYGAGMPPAWFVPVLLFVVWMTNLYNFMDGSDGLAGGMALFGFTGYGAAALLAGDETFAMLNFSIATAALGFLFFNFNPARVFMGDAGSIPLGFLAAAFGLLGWQAGYWPFWFPLLVFSPFIVDASVTLFRRMLRGEKLSQAHRSHYYQRLVQMGFGHRNTALAEYVLMFAAGACGLWSLGQGAAVQMTVLAFWGAAYAGLMAWLDARWERFMDKPVPHD